MPKETTGAFYSAGDKIFKPLDKREARRVVAKKYNISDKFILALGGRDPKNNIGRLIRAYHLICHEFSEEFKLVILGDTEDQHEIFVRLTQMLSIGDKIIFTKYVPKRNLPFFYNACECFIYPSLYDRFGLPLLEAASCGTPVIASKLSAVPKAFQNCFLYVDPYDVMNMAQNLYDAMTDNKLREELSIRSLEHSRRYSWEESPKQMLKVHKNSCKKNTH